jgi:hypothetical protein
MAKTRMIRLTTILAAAALVALAGCASTPVVDQNTSFADAPEWYDNVPAMCGVGSAKHRGVRDLTREAAVSSARRDLAKQVQVRMQGMLKDYARQGEAEGREFSEQDQVRVSRDIVDANLSGTRVVKTAMVESELYAMVCLDPQGFADQLAAMKTLSAKAQDYLKRRADAEFEELDKQLEKLNSN